VIPIATASLMALLIEKPTGIFDPHEYMTKAVRQIMECPATDLRITKHKKNVNRPRRSRRKEG